MSENAPHSKVHAQEITYELHTLGWKAFQDLCVTIVADIWKQTVQSFFSSQDGGRDGAFHGQWRGSDGVTCEGSFTVQSKFTAKAEKQLSLADLKDELSKAERLAARGLADNYVLFTNASLTGVNEAKIKEAFESVPHIKRFVAYGRESVSRMIRESPRLRMLVPRIYGLGDLSQILDERSYDQARELLSSLGDDLRKFVITDAYQKSAKALIEHGFVLLLGEAACGKSTIAAALAVGALDEWGNSTIKVRNADDFVRHSNPHEQKQFFWVDDAFGATQIDWQAAAAWNSAFPHVQAAINRGAKILFTSRDYIYRSAKDILKQSALPIICESQVVIHVEKLSKREREQILYNHIRLGKQTSPFKRRIKTLLPDVAAHFRFTPEIARRLGNPTFTKTLLLSKESLKDFVERPLELTGEIIRTLDSSSRAALGLVFMRGGTLPSPLHLSADEESAVALIGGTGAGVRKSLAALNESLVLRVIQGSGHVWKFKHPSIRDAFAAMVAEDAELLDIYLAGTPIDDLIHEVSCGDLGIDGVKVIVPESRYLSLLVRIDEFSAKYENRDYLHRFLARRCDRAFLKAFCERNPGFINNLHVGSYLYAVSSVDVIIRLHAVGLLPEEKRVATVAVIKRLAVSIPDSGCFRGDVATLFSEQERTELREHVRVQLLPSLDETVSDWRSQYSGGDSSPEDHFSELTSALSDFSTEFEDNAVAVALIEKASQLIKTAIKEMEEEEGDDFDDDSFSRDSDSHAVGDDSRSIFDDVDD